MVQAKVNQRRRQMSAYRWRVDFPDPPVQNDTLKWQLAVSILERVPYLSMLVLWVTQYTAGNTQVEGVGALRRAPIRSLRLR